MSNRQMQTMPYGTTFTAPMYQDEALNQQVSRLAETSLALAEHTVLQMQLHTALTQQVMSNTAALAASEEYFCQIAPSGRDAYHFIVEAYSRLEMKAIWGGQGNE